MADESAILQLQGLSQLLQAQPGVDRHVHLECVKTALRSLQFTTDAAMKVSAAVTACPGFDESEKSSLHALITERVEQPVKADRTRKALQDFTRMESFLTEALWDGLKQLSFSDATDQLMQHLYRLGLRNPTEGTFATMTALLLLFGPPKTPYQMHSTLTSVKQSWRSRSKRLQKSSPVAIPEPPHILALPEDIAGLSQEVQLAAFGTNKPCRTKAEGSSLTELVARIPQRITNSNYAAARDASTSMVSSHQHAGQDVGTVLAQVLGTALQSLNMAVRQNEINLQIYRPSSSSSLGRHSSTESLAVLDAVQQPALPAPQLALPAPPVASVAPTATEAALHNVMGVPRTSSPEVCQQNPVAVPAAQSAQIDTGKVEDVKPDSVTEVAAKQVETPAEPATATTASLALMDKLTSRDKAPKAKAQMKRPSAATSAGLKRPAAAIDSQEKKPNKKEPAAKDDKPPLKQDRKNVVSRAWHREYNRVYRKTQDETSAKAKASLASKKAGKAWDEENAST